MFGTSRLKNVTHRYCARKNISVTLKDHKIVGRERFHCSPFHVLFVCHASLLTNRTNGIIWQSLTTNGKESITKTAIRHHRPASNKNNYGQFRVPETEGAS